MSWIQTESAEILQINERHGTPPPPPATHRHAHFAVASSWNERGYHGKSRPVEHFRTPIRYESCTNWQIKCSGLTRSPSPPTSPPSIHPIKNSSKPNTHTHTFRIRPVCDVNWFQFKMPHKHTALLLMFTSRKWVFWLFLNAMPCSHWIATSSINSKHFQTSRSSPSLPSSSGFGFCYSTSIRMRCQTYLKERERECVNERNRRQNK